MFIFLHSLESKEKELENSERKIENLIKRNEYLENKLIEKRKKLTPKKNTDKEIELFEERAQFNVYSRNTPSGIESTDLNSLKKLYYIDNNNSIQTIKRLERIDLSPNCNVSSRNLYNNYKYNKYSNYISPNQDSKEHSSIEKNKVFIALPKFITFSLLIIDLLIMEKTELKKKFNVHSEKWFVLIL